MSNYKLVIVESPAKEKTIKKYLGDGYKVASSLGHIRDLPQKGGLHIDIANDFQPNYRIVEGKTKLVRELKQLADQSDQVIMASDEDREGEAIAWHLCQALKLKPEMTSRIVFHEITKEAIDKAIKNPRTIDQNLVDSQQARRLIDRIVGFELSPILWKKIKPGLSAGRVQSVAVNLIYEREVEIDNFQAASFFQPKAIFEVKDQTVTAELKEKFNDFTDLKAFYEQCLQTDFAVDDISQKESSRQPGAPFKTSTLQQKASLELGYSIKQTMRLAQMLYEAGHITYMRTDSLNLSQQALKASHKHIESQYGPKYLRPKQFQSGDQAAQEAHEAIRPTDITKTEVKGLDAKANNVYQLIRRQTLASQMAPAILTKTSLTVRVKDRPEVFQAQGEILKFDGFLKVQKPNQEYVILPDIKKGQPLTLREVNSLEKFSKPPARYTEASLVKKLEDLHIGRPSTYVPIISTIQDREYVTKIKHQPAGKTRRLKGLVLTNRQIKEYDSEEKYGAISNKLVPNPIAKIVLKLLNRYFTEIMDYGFTSKLEAIFDEIAAGKKQWIDELASFYDRFHPLVESVQEISKEDLNPKRELGVDPSDQKTVFARFGRFGPMLQKQDVSNEQEKPVFAPLPAGTTLDDITLEQALKAFQLPKLVGQDGQGQDVWVKNGPYGPYVQAGKTLVSLKNTDCDPFTVDLETCLELIEAKRKELSKRVVKDWGEIKILKGRFGDYVTDGKTNASVPKDQDGKAVSLKQAQEILAAKKAKPKFKPKN